jgi:hypothetical protein
MTLTSCTVSFRLTSGSTELFPIIFKAADKQLPVPMAMSLAAYTVESWVRILPMAWSLPAFFCVVL